MSSPDSFTVAGIDDRSAMRTLREKLVKIGAKVVRSARYVTFQLAEVAVSRQLFASILQRIGRLRVPTMVSTRLGLMGSAQRRGSESSAQDGEGVPWEALLAPFVPGERPSEGLTAVPTAARG